MGTFIDDLKDLFMRAEKVKGLRREMKESFLAEEQFALAGEDLMLILEALDGIDNLKPLP